MIISNLKYSSDACDVIMNNPYFFPISERKISLKNIKCIYFTPCKIYQVAKHNIILLLSLQYFARNK